MPEYRNPTPVVDCLITKTSNYPECEPMVLLISRKNAPLGWAIPGGFVDEGESFENAAIREAKEEVSLDVYLDELFYVYSDPNRDPRQHTTTTVFIAHAINRSDEPVAADDAVEARYFTRSAIERMIACKEIVFDHPRILLDFFKQVDGVPRGQIFTPMQDVKDAR